MERKKQTGSQLLLRFQEGSDLRDRLEVVAKANGRSVTQEILIMVEQALTQGDLRQEVEHLRAEVRMLGSRLWALENKT